MEQSSESEKSRLRKIYGARRRELTPGRRAEFDASIRAAIRALPEYRRVECVAFFVNWGAEPDLRELFSEKRAFLPRFAAERNEYDLVEIGGKESDLTPGKYNIPEPRPDLPAATREFVRREVFFLVPAVACDRSGVRLGRGGGFYDRLLAGVRIPPAGVVYSCQIAPDLPRAAHDCPLGAVVSETGVFYC